MTDLHRDDRDDRGLATLFLVLAMTVILVGAGFAIDVGQYVVNARSAQNSADATVLAVATDCVLTGAPIADYSPYRKSGQTITEPACGSGEASITVTKDVDGLFIPAVTAGAVDRSATARWGTLSKATTIPLVISDCEFSEALLDGNLDITLYLDDTKPQSGCSSLPGGFSQLAGDDCAVEITADGTAPGDPGADLQKQVPCLTNPQAPYLPHDVLIPMYDAAVCEADDCKGNGDYPIIGFAIFRVTGYSLNGKNFAGTLGKDCPDKARGKYCLQGDFTPGTTSGGTPGPSTDFGAYQIYLSS